MNETFSLNVLISLWPGLLLVAGVVDDLRSKKIHNKLIIVLFFLTLLLISFGGGQDRLITGLWGFSLGILLGAPLVLLGILGGGDFKLMAVIGLATDWNSLLWMSVYSILWGGLLGLVRAILDKSALQLIKNSFAILNPLTKKEEITLHKIPYSIALFFGWITYTFLVGRV